MINDIVTPEEIKATVPVTYVLWLEGHEPVDTNGSDLMYLSPFREDNTPSFACYDGNDDGVVDRWRDMALGEGGDVFDLIGQFSGKPSFADHLKYGQAIYAQFRDDSWEAPEPARRKGTIDIEEVRAELHTVYLNKTDDATAALAHWLYERRDSLHTLDARWLERTFRVVWDTNRDTLHVPYFSREEPDEIHISKYRRPGEKMMSLPGSRGYNSVLYGEWLDTDESRPVVLCEGETDVWSGTAATQEFCFLGLPTGAGYSEKLVPRLAGRRVLIALDGDEAGRGNAIRWADALAAENEVEVVLLPDGKDLSEVRDIPALLALSRSFETRIPGIGVVGGHYYRLNRQGEPGMALSDFLLTVAKVLRETSGAFSYEVEMGGREHLLLWHDLATKKSLTSWANERGRSWMGSDTDVQMLANNLRADSVWVESEEGYDVAGWHDGVFVWPGGSIGERAVRFVPTREGVEKQDFILREGKANVAAWLRVLLGMNLPDTIQPILAWLAAAPLRSQVVQFPILNISGSSGTGKTATIESVVPAWSGAGRFLGLSTQPTKYALTSLVASTNGFPLALDEYRPSGARSSEDMLRDVDDIIRAAYNSQVRETGGAPGNPMKKIKSPIQAPLIVSGESTLAETSLRERSIMVRMRTEGRRVEAMESFNYMEHDGKFAHTFLRWLIYRESRLDIIPSGPADLPPRMRYNLGVLQAGWGLILDFAFDHGIHDLPDHPDLSAIVQEYKEANDSNPIKDALEAVLGLDRSRYGDTVWIEDETLYVAVEPFCKEAEGLGFVLPGNAVAVGKFLRETYGAEKMRVRRMGDSRVKASVLPARLPFGDELD